MDPATILALADGAIGLVEKLAPSIAQLFKKGQITPEEQQALMKRLDALRPGGTAFSGPEWEVK